MAELKQKLRADLTASMKAKDKPRTATLRMVLAAIGKEEVAGDTARELSDDEIVTVLTKEAKKRRESSEAFEQAGRPEQAAAESAEGEIIAEYLPQQLTEAELTTIVDEAVEQVTADLGEKPGIRQMGQVMKLVTPKTAGRADGAAVAAAVKSRLA